jgi:tetratricopeptide (TPR) repeat protein
MKKLIIKFSSIAMIALTIASCDKKLDIEPRQSVDAATAIENTDDVEAAVVGSYALLGGPALYGTNLLLLADLFGSDASSGSTSAARYATWGGTFQGYRQVYNKTTLTRDNSEAARTWTAAYRTINMANIVLSNINLVTNATKKNTLEGEAFFVRGIMHFELVRLYALPWGATANNDHLGVVIRTTATKTETEAFAKEPRNTVAQVYQQVINDLTAAVAKLPNDNGTRVDKFTAHAFLARVYLQQGNYAAARDAANAVIQSNKYRLNASVTAVFDNKNSNESVWEIQQNDQNNAGTSNDGMATFYASLTGIGRGDVRIPSGFVNLYPRIARVDSIVNPVTNVVIRRDTVPDIRRTELFYSGRTNNFHSGKWKSFSQNIPVIRIAEMYLIRAEANLRLGTVVGDTPVNDYNRTRVRAQYLPVATVTLQEIIDEKFKELAFEGLRIHEVKRLRLSVGAFPWNSPRLILPIPQRDIDASGGTLIQNEAYL